MNSLAGTLEQQIGYTPDVLRILRIGLIVVDERECVLVWNDWMQEASGIQSVDAIQQPLSALFPAIANSRFHHALQNALASGYPSVLSNALNNVPLPLVLNDGQAMQQAIQIIPFSLPQGTRGAVVQITDVSAARTREEMIRTQAKDLGDVQQRQNALLHSIPDIAWLKDVEGRYLAINDKFSTVYGMHPAEVEGRHDREIFPPEYAAHNEITDRHVLEAGVTKRYDESIMALDGKTTWVETVKVPIFNDQMQIIGIAGVSRDITERKASEERIHFLAHYDTLTSLPNRFMLFERLEHLLAIARRDETQVALFFVDLDRFKIINDSLGHTMGDLLLQVVADRLKERSREVDIIARVGGDEFVIALTGIKEIDDVAVIAQKFLDTVARPYLINGHHMHITPSLGISLFPRDGQDTASLIKNADRAMYRVKQTGRNGYEFFDAEMNAAALDQLSLEHGLRYALERNELELLYQSQIDLRTGAIVGAEAQLRWHHPKLGLIMPSRFIGIMEECGLIGPIGEWILAAACRQNRQWQRDGLPPITIAVNLSAVQLNQKHFVEIVSRSLREAGLDPRYLDLEITESVIMHNAESTISTLDQLKDIGVKLSVDDFGTGYSSLSYLKRFPIDTLKIDRSFVRDVTSDSNDAAITGAIIAIAKQLNLNVVAEGVETLGQLNFLKTQNCDQIQGFYFSKPLSAEDFAIHLKNGVSGRHFEQFAN